MTPALKALVFQLLESTYLSNFWFQTSTSRPYNAGGDDVMGDVTIPDATKTVPKAALVGRCKLNPGLKATGYKL